MKISRQHIKNVPEVSPQHNEVTVNKSIKRTASGYQKAPLVKTTFGVPQNIPRKRISFTERVEEDEHPVKVTKVKLQLFPLTESFQIGLEKDGYNPFLELTLSVKKKISSVIKHLNTKWGSSSVVNGELMLFPYNTRLENVSSSEKWTQNNSDITSGEVYDSIGSPTVFRLRYGWITSLELEKNSEAFKVSSNSRNGKLEKLKVVRKGFTKPININEAVEENLPSDAPPHHIGVQKLAFWDDNKNYELSYDTKKLAFETNMEKIPGEREFSLDDNFITSLSMGGLFSEASLQRKMNKLIESKTNSQEEALQNVDSFDAYIAAAQLNSSPLVRNSHSSILDAEETCHAFSFGKSSTSGGGTPKLFKSPKTVEQPKDIPLTRSKGVFDDDRSLGFSDMKWDSRGPFDLGLTNSRPVLNFGDSMSEKRKGKEFWG